MESTPIINGAHSVEWCQLETLVPYAQNARTHGEEQIKVLASSIERFGFNSPVLIDGAGGIIAGHGRVLAAKYLGLESVPVVRLDHLSPDEKQAFILVENKSSELSGWDDEILKTELKDLFDKDFDPISLGFATKEIDKLLAEIDIEEFKDHSPSIENVPSVNESPVTTIGDVWILGNHRLICGDSENPFTLKTLMDSSMADLIFTDPPYGVAYKGKVFEKIKNDDKQGAELVAFFSNALRNALMVTKAKSAVYVCGSWKTYPELVDAVKSAGLLVSSCIVWDKCSIGVGADHYRSQHEFILYCWRGGIWKGDRSQSNVWSIGRDGSGTYKHPTQKPIRLIEKALRNSSKKGDIVLDVFGGSGSSLIACERLDRSSRLIELEPQYADVIVERWQKMTGQSAILKSDGLAFSEVKEARYKGSQ